MAQLIDTSIFIELERRSLRVGALAGAAPIAATALAHGYAVLTQNLRDFQRVPGLVVRQPSW